MMKYIVKYVVNYSDINLNRKLITKMEEILNGII